MVVKLRPREEAAKGLADRSLEQPLHSTVIRIGEAMQVPEQLDAIRQTTEVESLDEAHIRECVRRFEVDGRQDVPKHSRADRLPHSRSKAWAAASTGSSEKTGGLTPDRIARH